jgi:undecaprenyl-diphosphatase
MYDYLVAAILGVVEGLTEFLPVSSTGHLLLLGHFLGFESKGKAFEVLVQLGAILAILLVYFHRLLDIAKRLPSDPAARRFVIGVLIAFLPAAVIGALAHGFIKGVLFNPFLVCTTLIAGGLVLLVVDEMELEVKHSDATAFPLPMYLKIGFMQCLAMIPGVSRSGATIVGAMLLGADKRAAAEFSFFLAMPTMAGAFAYDLMKNYKILTADDATLIVIGFFTAFISALFVVRGFLDFVSRPSPGGGSSSARSASSRWCCSAEAGSGDPLVGGIAEIGDHAALAGRAQRLAGVAPVQDQPVMRVPAEFRRNRFLQPELDLEHGLARRDPQPVGDAEDMGIDRVGDLAEGDVEHDIGGLAADAGQRLQRLAAGRNHAAERLDQALAQQDHVLRLGAVEADRPDQLAHRLLAERQHLLRRVGQREQAPRRLVDAGIGGLGREHDRDQQREGVEIFELALRLRPDGAEAAEDLADFGGLARLDGGAAHPALRAVRYGHRGVIMPA